MRIRLLACLAAVAALVVVGRLAFPVHAADLLGPSCGNMVVKGDRGVQIVVQFAKNGAVQRYVFDERHMNPGDVDALRTALLKRYGPPGVDAPPLDIVSFRKDRSSNLEVPDRGVDSCGRTVTFQ